MKYRELNLKTGVKILLGKDSKNNDELVGEFKGKPNTILHTVLSGSPFCVIEKPNPNKEEVYEAGIYCAKRSHAWRDKKADVKMHVFTGHDVKKSFWMKEGSWKLKNKPKEITIKKKDILKFRKKR